MPNKHSPQRTCLGCRRSGDQRDMLRMVCSPENRVVVDIHHKLPGRGVYVCYDPACFKAAVGKGSLARGFRKSIVETDAPALLEQARSLLYEQLLNHVSMLRKSGHIDVGYTKVYDNLKPQAYAAVVMAADVSEPRVEKMRSKAVKCSVTSLMFASKALLGQAIGRDEASTLGLKPGGLTEKFMHMVTHYRQLVGEF